VDAIRIAGIPLFAGLTLDQVEEIAGACNELRIEPGGTLLQEGDFGYSMFAIAAGTAEVVKDGKVLRTLGPGDVFGEIAVLSSGRRTATVVATSPMEVVTILNRDVWRIERELPEIGAALRAQIASEVEPAST
jgi:cAMP-dependent protein kinase regulator/CRP/FNR family cyclic AMP-dependent transcriptional regulator/cGMP-dependent protein kinase 2